MTKDTTRTNSNPENTIWVMPLGRKAVSAADTPPPTSSEGSDNDAVLAWLLADRAGLHTTDDDHVALTVLAECIREHHPCVLVRGQQTNPESGPEPQTSVTVMNMPRVTEPDPAMAAKARASGSRKQVCSIQHNIIVFRDPQPGETGAVEDARDRPLRDPESVVTHCARHLMTQLPELSDSIREVLIERVTPAQA